MILEGAPTSGEFFSYMMSSGELLSRPERAIPVADTRYPVVARFAICHTPPGFAPQEVREAWVGLELPVRYRKPEADGIPVWSIDALSALDDAGQTDALQFWTGYYENKASVVLGGVVFDEERPEFMANMNTLCFDKDSGELSPL